jgi:hypothetical protein
MRCIMKNLMKEVLFGIDYAVSRAGRPFKRATDDSATFGVAKHWHGILSLIALAVLAGLVIGAPVADRDMVPSTFVDRLQATFDRSMPQDTSPRLPLTIGQPVMSVPPVCNPTGRC